MEGKSRSGFRRTKFVDDDQGLHSTEDDSYVTFRNSTIPIHAVLHDAVPDLGSNSPDLRNVEISSTLANLTEEFNDLTRKMTLLKETLKVTRNVGAKRIGLTQTNSSSQTLQFANLSDVVSAKRVILDCIVELTFISHFLDGNEKTASVYREKLQHTIANDYEKAETIVIQGLSVAPSNHNPMARGENLVADSAIGASEHFLIQHRREVAMQTEISDIPINRNSPKSDVSLDPNAVVCKDTHQPEQKKNCKWYSCCAGGKRNKKSNEKPQGKAKASSSKKSLGKSPEKSSTHVVICDDNS